MNRLLRALNWTGLVLTPLLAMHFAFKLYSGEPAPAGVWLWAFTGLLFAFLDTIIILSGQES